MAQVGGLCSGLDASIRRIVLQHPVCGWAVFIAIAALAMWRARTNDGNAQSADG